MFEKIHKNKLSKIILWKYFFQIFVFSIIVAMVLFVFLCLFVPEAFEKNELIDLIFAVILVGMIGDSPNIILSLLPFLKLFLDNITGNKVEKAQFKVVCIADQWELCCLLLKKRFMIDTFSKKKNDESWVRVETKEAKHKVFRFYWNESYGGSLDEIDNEFLNNTIYEFTYLKFSHVIVEIKKIDSMRLEDGLVDYDRLRQWNNHLPKKTELMVAYGKHLEETKDYDENEIITPRDRRRNLRNFKKYLKEQSEVKDQEKDR